MDGRRGPRANLAGRDDHENGSALVVQPLRNHVPAPPVVGQQTVAVDAGFDSSRIVALPESGVEAKPAWLVM